MQTRLARLYQKGDLRIETAAVTAPGPGEVLLKMAAAGICGSDLHYYQDGGFGPVRVREPIIPGHEASGTVSQAGEGVDLKAGTLVAVNPSQPCGHCEYCDQAMPIHCLDMRFMGSAMRLPHEQGMFREWLVVSARQCFAAGAATTAAEAACSEPLSVCLHAASRAGDIAGKRVLVTGAGPIGALMVAVACYHGASEIVVTDLADAALTRAKAMGASRTINVAKDAHALAEFEAGKGYFDLVFECSAAVPAIRSAIAAIRPRGTIVQVGVTGEIPIPLNAIVGKELHIHGTQRFHEEFAAAVELISSRKIDVRPIISHNLPLEQADAAFILAGDRAVACKVQLIF
ncbi:L-idonate 5-dehydrogenase [Rhizobium leguminosarum]|uniref:L-idonate 5-dehydrogenase n=1 Tax=Rhizobium leguminosarum TaxID=384 RepID=A0AAE2SYM5_RHILE|nr:MULTISPECIES: L-idonate 5-dehydrogenase [Rhizobium]MBB4293186.1 L-idonate 5-dehydrogenase [Rhizobium leguminosarum]MBB4299991.1 L-idonate 5-dehydrogenase [Rhizobium leguminosarum]MBB4311117.1 L-idonate 5-dehydrogenase [Rhizobium leguminosarum]MBB4435344.1 L-idonate 5-dehydrogenase [Rhizobium esperanzae]MBB4532276.1 L-idonate 5-dehydrogenase [Rhizobium leguminosarum]